MKIDRLEERVVSRVERSTGLIEFVAEYELVVFLVESGSSHHTRGSVLVDQSTEAGNEGNLKMAGSSAGCFNRVPDSQSREVQSGGKSLLGRSSSFLQH